jgi:TRAP-type C4-dicarboxylate transport system substrate-binding protein
MRRSISNGYFVFIFGILFCLCNIGLCYAQEKYTMRFSHGLPEDHFIANQYQEWATLINERSKGVLKVEIYPSAQLFKDLEVIRAIQMGTIESGGAYSFNIARSVSEFNILDVPFLFHTTEEMLKVAKSEVGTLLIRAAEKQGIKVLAWFPFPQEGEGILSKKPIKVPSDCKGLVARATGPPSAQLIKLWGGGASSLSGAEVYMGLQRGTIGATFSTIETSVERKIYEVAPYSVILPWGAVFAMPLMNAEFFNKLPKGFSNQCQSKEGFGGKRSFTLYSHKRRKCTLGKGYSAHKGLCNGSRSRRKRASKKDKFCFKKVEILSDINVLI